MCCPVVEVVCRFVYSSCFKCWLVLFLSTEVLEFWEKSLLRLLGSAELEIIRDIVITLYSDTNDTNDANFDNFIKSTRTCTGAHRYARGFRKWCHFRHLRHSPLLLPAGNAWSASHRQNGAQR